MKTASCVVGVMLLAGCVTSPIDGEVVDDHTEPVEFSVWALDEGVEVEIWCEPYYPPGPAQLVTTLTTKSFSWEQEGDRVHLGSGEGVVPESCWSYFHNSYHTIIRATQEDNYSYLTFDQDGLDCLYDSTISGATSPVTSATDCQTGNAIVLNASN